MFGLCLDQPPRFRDGQHVCRAFFPLLLQGLILSLTSLSQRKSIAVDTYFWSALPKIKLHCSPEKKTKKRCYFTADREFVSLYHNCMGSGTFLNQRCDTRRDGEMMMTSHSACTENLDDCLNMQGIVLLVYCMCVHLCMCIYTLCVI